MQPGSRAIEAMVQTLMWRMTHRDCAAGLARPRFEELAIATAAAPSKVTWKYRGQVVLRNRRIVIDLEVTDASAPLLALVDGLRIYTAEDRAVRVVDDVRSKDR